MINGASAWTKAGRSIAIEGIKRMVSSIPITAEDFTSFADFTVSTTTLALISPIILIYYLLPTKAVLSIPLALL